MSKPSIPNKNRIRSIEETNFAWIDRNLNKLGFLEDMTQEEFTLYSFLCLVADKNGLSFWGNRKIRETLKMGYARFQAARNRLLEKELITFERDSRTNQVIYQVLSLPVESFKVEQRVKNEEKEFAQHVVTNFYAKIAIKASSPKRRKGESQAIRLLRDGFSKEEIQFAKDWAINNLDEIHSFGIVPEIIGQALQVKGKILDEVEKEERNRLQEIERRNKFQREEELNKQISRLRQSLTEEDLKRIKEMALTELGEKYEKIRIEAARRLLLANKEDEVIKREYLK